MAVDYFTSLRPASFRGIAFDIPEGGSAFGRRIQTHDYPGRDEPYHEDLGLSVQSFTIEAILHGADYIARAAALESVLKKKGPGRLVHPLYGDLDVVVKSATRRHSSQSAGEVSFSVSFEKYGAPLYPSPVRNTASGLEAASNAGFLALQSDFSARFIPVFIDFLTQDTQSRAVRAAHALAAHLKNQGVFRNFSSGLFPEIWSVEDSPAFAGQVVGLFSAIVRGAAPEMSSPVGSLPAPEAPANAIRVMAALRGASAERVDLGFTPGAFAITQSTREKNASSIDALFRLSALAATVSVARHAVYESREEALFVRQDTADRLAAVRDDLGNLGWDASWRAGGDLLAALSRDINERIGRLPRTARIRTSNPRPSLALANRLYGDDPSILFDRAADIVARNRVRHPGFVPAGEMEVLIDAA